MQKEKTHYCFGILIQSELDSCKEQRSSYFIRKSVFNEVSLDIYSFFQIVVLGDNSSQITHKDGDVISDFINEYYSEKDKDEIVFIDFCDYVYCELNMPLHFDFVIARMLIKNGSAFFFVFFFK